MHRQIIYDYSLVRVVSNNFLIISFFEKTPLNIQLTLFLLGGVNLTPPVVFFT